MADTTSEPGLVVEYTHEMDGWQLTQRGNAFLRCILGAWVSLTGVGFLADLPAQTVLGAGILAIPAAYLYVLRNYPGRLSEAQLDRLRENEEVLSVEGYNLERTTETQDAPSDDELVKKLARTKMRLKAYQLDSLKSSDELVDEVYDDLADLGYYVTHEQVEDWTKNLLPTNSDSKGDGCSNQ